MNLTTAAEIMFWASVGLILYTYLGYPLLVFVLARLLPKPVRKGAAEPPVTMIITAFNEEQAIRSKLENSLLLDYPKSKLQIIVASDCSNDGTDDIVRDFADRGVQLVRQEHRQGKTAAQNLAVKYAEGEIVVFSDATSMYEANAIRELTANFADESVGCVAGRLIYVDPSATTVGSGAKSYWGYETFIKRSESTYCSLIGVSGCIYAVRRKNYVPMYPEACSDFLIATIVYEQGLRTVYEPKAVCTEETNGRSGKEMRMRIRVISQTLSDLWRNRTMLNPFRSGSFAFQLLSHKVLRYAVPVFLVAAFISSGLLAFDSAAFLFIFALQAAFVLAAFGVWMLESLGIKSGPFSLPLYFFLANAATVAAFIQFLRGERYAAWETAREPR